jgi:hypothetical protein
MYRQGMQIERGSGSRLGGESASISSKCLPLLSLTPLGGMYVMGYRQHRQLCTPCFTRSFVLLLL